MGFTAGQILRASQLGPVPVTSATRPADPHEGQLIVESDTGMVAIYSGSAWRYLAPTGAVSTHAEYNQSGAQSIPNDAATVISFGTESTSTPLVTRAASGAGHSFTLNRSGHWAITFNLRFASGGSSAERSAEIRDAAGAVASQNDISSAAVQFSVSLVRYFASGTVLTMSGYQISTGARDTVPGTGNTRLHIAWIHS